MVRSLLDAVVGRFQRMRESRRDALLIVVLCLLAYLPGYGGDFVYDDNPQVLQDPRVQEHDWKRAVTESYWLGWRRGGLYRPVTTLTLVAQGYLGRTRPQNFKNGNL